MDANVPEDKPDQQSPENGGDHIQVGDIKDGKAIAIGHGATAVYQGLSVEEVAALVVELKHKDQPTVWDGRIPYLGLATFRESDAQFFFGRERLVDDLLERVQQANFITIAGPSGSGKSSVARAGLLHALREGRLESSDTWLLAAMQPKGDPIEQLAIAIDRMAGSPGAGDYLRERAMDNPLALNRQIETLLSDDARQRCVLLVDQFEEIFTQTKDEITQAAFINLITAAARAEAGRVLIVLSLRSDFVSHCARYSDLRRLMSRQFQLVGAMAPQDLAKAITLPALEVGSEIDPDLVSTIMTDMKGEPGALPLMSFALQDLFEAEKTRKGQPMDLTLEEYLQRGGIESALERHANHVFESFSDEQKVLARGIFARLIEVGEGQVDTRRTVTFLELVPAGASQELVVKTVAKLAEEDARLLTTSGVVRDEQIFDQPVATAATVTIAHEKLIDAWPWLRKLVDENRVSIKLQNGIAEAARTWESHDRNSSYLYTGARLEDAEEKLAGGLLQLSESSNDFVAASVLRRKVAARNRQLVMAGLAALTILAIIAALFAFRFAGQASDNAADAQANQAAAEAEKQRAEAQTTRAVMAEQEAVAARGTAEAEATRAFINEEKAIVNAAVAERQARAARFALSSRLASQAHSLADIYLADQSESIDGRALGLLLAAEAINTALRHGDPVPPEIDTRIREVLASLDAGTSRILPAAHVGDADSEPTIALSSDARWIIQTADSRLSILLDLEEPDPLRNSIDLDTVLNGEISIDAVSFLPGSVRENLADVSLAVSGQGIVLGVDIVDGRVQAPKVRIQEAAGNPKGPLISADGRWFLAHGDANTASLHDLTSDNAAVPLTIINLPVETLSRFTITPDEQHLIAIGDDEVYEVDLVAPDAAVTTAKLNDDLGSQNAFEAISPDGRWFVRGISDGSVRLWDLADLRPSLSPDRWHTFPRARAASFDPKGSLLLIGGWGTTRMWDLSTFDVSDPTPDLVIIDEIRSEKPPFFAAYAFDGSGERLAAVTDDGDIYLWVLPREHLVDLACKAAGRNLSPTEWKEYLSGDVYQATCPEILLTTEQALAQAGDYALREMDNEAGEAYALASQLAIKTGEAETNNDVCWQGSLDGFPKIVLPACERAVELLSGDPSASTFYMGAYRDSRGLARALTGDYQGAIEDFEAYTAVLRVRAASNASSRIKLKQREDWIAQLKEGNDPFNPEVLLELRLEATGL